MTTSKHTPGPWYATTRQGSWDWLVAQSEQMEICQMFHDGTDLNEVGEANARLVAAAPELLEALRELQAYAIQEVPGGGAHHHPVWAKVADALDKASQP